MSQSELKSMSKSGSQKSQSESKSEPQSQSKSKHQSVSKCKFIFEPWLNFSIKMIIKLETDLITAFVLIKYLEFSDWKVSDKQCRVRLHSLPCRLGNVSDRQIDGPGLLAPLLGGQVCLVGCNNDRNNCSACGKLCLCDHISMKRSYLI
jgi:hypothetical protein